MTRGASGRGRRRRGGAGRERFGDVPGLDGVRERRLEAAGRCDALSCAVVDERQHPRARTVAQCDHGRRHRGAGHVDHECIGVGESPQHRLGLGAQHPVGRQECGSGCRDLRDHVDPLTSQARDEGVGLVDRDDDPHEPAPVVGTIDRAEPSAMAARVADTSVRGITSSSAAAPPPIIDSSRVTDTTVASATRMRGSS